MSNVVFYGTLLASICVFLAGLRAYIKYGKPIPRTEPRPIIRQVTECVQLPCGHTKCCEQDDQCGRPEHRFCGYCQALDDYRSAESYNDELTKERDEAKELLGKVMDRVKGPEAGLSEDLNQILRDEIQKAFEPKG
jgi:hypothetical protein